MQNHTIFSKRPNLLLIYQPWITVIVAQRHYKITPHRQCVILVSYVAWNIGCSGFIWEYLILIIFSYVFWSTKPNRCFQNDDFIDVAGVLISAIVLRCYGRALGVASSVCCMTNTFTRKIDKTLLFSAPSKSRHMCVCTPMGKRYLTRVMTILLLGICESNHWACLHGIAKHELFSEEFILL